MFSIAITSASGFRSTPYIRYIYLRYRYVAAKHTRARNLGSKAHIPTYSTPPRSVASTFVQEFQTAKIRFTTPGKLKLQTSCQPFSYPQIFEPEKFADNYRYELLQNIVKEINKGPADIEEEYLYVTCMWEKFRLSPALWRSEYAWRRYQRHKIYTMWEALYYRSTIFRDLIEDEESSSQMIYTEEDNLESCPLWLMLDSFYYWGMVDREDVDRLPDPLELWVTGY
ncbi:hypothetical protein TWF506_011355 [Arthrobotrys conoides]|uniref:Uncharacterized protein n=1 Tax=Arthrobotrys conoides TaxID=74498 RepID=A0AAN8RS11_9PEZI